MRYTAEKVIEEVAGICYRSGAASVLLYGSRAKGTARPRSDIDIAVEGAERFDEMKRQIEDIPTLFSIDFVNLDSCKNETLKSEVRTHGIKLQHPAS